jgi:hypothetical protein
MSTRSSASTTGSGSNISDHSEGEIAVNLAAVVRPHNGRVQFVKGTHTGKAGEVRRRKSTITGADAKYWLYVVALEDTYDTQGRVQKGAEVPARHDEIEPIGY